MKISKSIVLLTFVLLSGCYTTMTNFNGDVIEVLTDGEWSWATEEDSCTKSVQIIEFNDSKTLMTMSWKDQSGDIQGEVYKYKIHEIVDSKIRTEMIDEDRKTKSNKSVSWDLIVKSPQLYCWHRTDWPEISCTKDMYKYGSKDK